MPPAEEENWLIDVPCGGRGARGAEDAVEAALEINIVEDAVLEDAVLGTPPWVGGRAFPTCPRSQATPKSPSSAPRLPRRPPPPTAAATPPAHPDAATTAAPGPRLPAAASCARLHTAVPYAPSAVTYGICEATTPRYPPRPTPLRNFEGTAIVRAENPAQGPVRVFPQAGLRRPFPGRPALPPTSANSPAEVAWAGRLLV